MKENYLFKTILIILLSFVFINNSYCFEIVEIDLADFSNNNENNQVKISPLQMNFNPFDDILNLMLNDIRHFEMNNNNDSGDFGIFFDEDSDDEEHIENKKKVDKKEKKRKSGKLQQNNVLFKKPIMQEVEILVTPEGTTETITTINPDGLKTVEVHKKSNGNLNKGKGKNRLASPFKVFNSFDEAIEDMFHSMIFGDSPLQLDNDENSKIKAEKENIIEENKKLNEIKDEDLIIEETINSESKVVPKIKEKVEKKEDENKEINIENLTIKENRVITGNTLEK